MNEFTTINLSELPAPVIIDRSSYSEILEALKTEVLRQEPSLSSVLSLESEPITKILQAWAYREVTLRAQIDNAGKGNMLAFAQGANLDNLGALMNVKRLTIQSANPSTNPPTLEILETDADYRKRIQLAPESFTNAGSVGAYKFHTLGADKNIKDCSVSNVELGEVLVTILSKQGSGVAGEALQNAVLQKLDAKTVRPLTDIVKVQSAAILEYEVDAELKIASGPDSALVLEAAKKALKEYVTKNHGLGLNINKSAIYAALHQAGVSNVNLKKPANDIATTQYKAAFCTNQTIVAV